MSFCACLSVCPSCLCAQLTYLYHTHPMLLTCQCLHTFGSVSVLLLSLPCHCPVCDSCCWVSLPRCVSDPVGVSLVGSLSVANVTGVCVSGLALFWGDSVCIFLASPSPKSGHPGSCLLCPQPISALPGEGLTLQSVQPAVHRMFPRRCLRRHPLPLATPGSGPRRPGQRGWGCSVWGGVACQGPGMRVGGGEATGPTGSASFLPRLSLPGCPPGAGGGRDEPHGLRVPGWGTARPARTGFCWAS